MNFMGKVRNIQDWKGPGTLYTVKTDSFIIQSLERMHAFFVAYDYDTNTIFVTPTKELEDDTIIQAFEQVFNELKEKGYTPTRIANGNLWNLPITAQMQ